MTIFLRGLFVAVIREIHSNKLFLCNTALILFFFFDFFCKRVYQLPLNTLITQPYPLSRIRYDRLALSSEPVTIELQVSTALSYFRTFKHNNKSSSYLYYQVRVSLLRLIRRLYTLDEALHSFRCTNRHNIYIPTHSPQIVSV